MDGLRQFLKSINQEGKIDKFERFYELLISYNEKFNLTGITKKEEVEYKHFIDSLAGVEEIKGEVLDIGAGAGFPSVPLAIVREDCSFLMIDSLNKRIEFLKTVIDELKLKNIQANHCRAEELKKKTEKKFDSVVVRAVAKLNTLCEYSLPYLKTGGKLIVYKSETEEEIKEAKNALAILGGKIERVAEKDFILNGEKFKRNLIIIKKERETPKKYPREGNKPKLEPLS